MSRKYKFALWQAENHPIELFDSKTAHQKLACIHNNPEDAGFVSLPQHWTHSRATDYTGSKGLLEIIYLDPLLV